MPTREAQLFTNYDAGLFETTTKIMSSYKSLPSHQSQVTASNVLETIGSSESLLMYFESQPVALSNPTTILDPNLSFLITNHHVYLQSRSKMKDNNFIGNTTITTHNNWSN